MHSSRGRQQGFSLLELIGVMSIMAILAATVVPNVIGEIKVAQGDAEQANVQQLADVLRTQILDAKSIPSGTGTQWVDLVAEASDLSRDQIAANVRGFDRAYYVDPKFMQDRNRRFNGYTQTTGLTAAPYSPRIMLISSLTGRLPGRLRNHDEFDAVWDQTDTARIKASTDVVIARVNLRADFLRVLMSNRHTQQPGFQLESGTVASIPGASGSRNGEETRYVFRSTRLNLHGQPFPGGALEHSSVVREQASYLYTDGGGAWAWSIQ